MQYKTIQNNLLKPDGGNSGLHPSCIATPFGFFVGDDKMIVKSLERRVFYPLYCSRCNIPWIGKKMFEKCPKCGKGDYIHTIKRKEVKK